MPRPITTSLLFTAVTLLVCLSCSRLNDIESRLDVLEQRVTTLEDATAVLRTLYDQGQIITAVTPIEGGYRLDFSDGHRLDIEDCVTPLLLIDQDGYWNISYDNGATYSRMKDSQGADIPAGVSVRVTTDENGYYVIEHYLQANLDSVVATVPTSLTSDPSKIIAAVTEDSRGHTVTITMADGKVFTFSKAHITPTSIALLTTQTLLVGRGDTVSLAFRVNPSTATFDYDPHSRSCQLLLDRIGDTRSYVNTPSDYALVKVEQAYDEQGVMKAGEYRAYIADLMKSETYSDHIALVIRTTDDGGQTVEVSSSAAHLRYTDNTLSTFSFLHEHNPGSLIADVHGTIDGTTIRVMSPYITRPDSLVATFDSEGYKVYAGGVEQVSGTTVGDYSRPVTIRVENPYGEATEYHVEVIHSGLPVMFIDTPAGMDITSKSDWLYGADLRLVAPDGTPLLEGSTAIKGRGNSTWGRFPKKSYNIKLEERASLLGMPSHSRWSLQANWVDRTLLRNRVAFRLGECTQLPYTPRCEYVELVLNGRHMGNYLLCEQLKIDENRINIHPLTADDDDITGGYLMEIDKYYDETNKFRSAVRDFPYMFKYPDEKELTDTMFAYMQGYIDAVEHALYDDFASRRWADYLDLATFVDYWFASELTSNAEGRHPQSIYLYKDRGSRLCAGPIWDNDYGTFMPGRSHHYYMREYLYYPALFEDAAFVALVKERWPAAKEHFLTVADYIDAEASRLSGSARINLSLWPISIRVNEDEALSYADAVALLKQSYTDKLQWLDEQIATMND